MTGTGAEYCHLFAVVLDYVNWSTPRYREGFQPYHPVMQATGWGLPRRRQLRINLLNSCWIDQTMRTRKNSRIRWRVLFGGLHDLETEIY